MALSQHAVCADPGGRIRPARCLRPGSYGSQSAVSAGTTFSQQHMFARHRKGSRPRYVLAGLSTATFSFPPAVSFLVRGAEERPWHAPRADRRAPMGTSSRKAPTCLPVWCPCLRRALERSCLKLNQAAGSFHLSHRERACPRLDRGWDHRRIHAERGPMVQARDPGEGFRTIERAAALHPNPLPNGEREADRPRGNCFSFERTRASRSALDRAPPVSPWIRWRCRKVNSTATGTVREDDAGRERAPLRLVLPDHVEESGPRACACWSRW